jgi:hypothetical protein
MIYIITTTQSSRRRLSVRIPTLPAPLLLPPLFSIVTKEATSRAAGNYNSRTLALWSQSPHNSNAPRRHTELATHFLLSIIFINSQLLYMYINSVDY